MTKPYVQTTRNIDTEWWDSWFHGGLQYQAWPLTLPTIVTLTLTLTITLTLTLTLTITLASI